MHLRNYIKLLFILMLTVSVGLFMFSAYALIAGRQMEKEYVEIVNKFNEESYKIRISLINEWFTYFERETLTKKYEFELSTENLCYLPVDKLLGRTEEQIISIKIYNDECKKRWISESIIRPEIEEVYKKWITQKEFTDQKIGIINSSPFSDGWWKGKLDTNFINHITIISAGGVFMSFIILILIYRIPETPSERKDEHPKHK